jgi:murein DD-endopeptidase MepM/ murein hydrolase activator NlpD
VLVGRGYVVIRPEFAGDWDRRVSGQSSRSGALGGRAFGAAFAKDARAGMSALWKGAKWSAIGSGLAAATVGFQGLGAAALAASAVAVPALSAIGTAGAAIGVGLKGVGDAFKAFDSAAQDAKAAATATRQVESAQRALARAQAGVGEARAAAARQVRDAEKGLIDAQRDALDVQRELNGARLDAARALEDMNTRLAESALDQQEAAIRVREAEEELAQARVSGDKDAIEKAELAAKRAKLNADQQSRDYKRLQEDAAKANKAGVEGSDQVLAVKERISEANQRVADAEQNLRDAQVDGAKQVKDAQEAVADAARALADAQSAAASTVSKVDQAMAKLTPNARNFVETVKEMGPAWGEVRKATQEALFEGFGDSFRDMSQQIIPDLRDGLSGAATEINKTAREWMRGVKQMSDEGLLKRFFDGNNELIRSFSKWPEEATRGWVQLSIAAQPAMDRITDAVAGASTRLSERMDTAFASGAMERAISGAVENLTKLKGPYEDLKTIFGNLFDAMSGPGQQALGMFGQVLDGLARITSKPEVKEALTSIFQSFGRITETVLTEAILPLVEHGLPPLARGLEWVADVLPPAVEWLKQFASVAIDKIGAGIDASARGTQSFFDAFKSGQAADIGGQASMLERFGAATRSITDKVAANVRSALDGFRSGDLAPAWFQSSDKVTGAFDRLGVAARAVSDVVRQDVWPALLELGRGIQSFVEPVVRSVASIWTDHVQHVLERFATVVREAVGPTVRALGEFISSRLSPALEMLGGKVSGLLDALAPLIRLIDQVVTFVVKLGAEILGFLAPVLIRLAGPIFTLLVKGIGFVLTAVTGVIRGITWLGEAAQWLWQVMQPVFEVIGIAARILAAVIFTVLVAPVVIGFNLIAAAANFLWDNAIGPVWDKIKAGTQWLWDNILGPIIQKIWMAIQGWGLIGLWLWDNVIRPVTEKIGGAVSSLWDNTLKPKIEAITGGFKEIGHWAEDAYNKVAEWFGKIGTKIGEVLGAFKPAFDGAKQGVSEVWEGLKEVAAGPVRFIVDKVYMDGIRKVWNFIIGAVGLGNLSLPEAHFAGGGVVPGYAPGVDSVPARLSPGEGVLVPEAVRALGPKWIYRTNAYFSRGRKPGAPERFAMGGIVGHGAGMPMGGLNPVDPRDWDDYAKKGLDWVKRGLGAAYEGLKQVPGVGDVIQWAEKLVRGAAAEAAERLLRPVAGWAGEGIANAAVGATRLGGVPLNKDATFIRALRDAPKTLIDKLVARIRTDDAEQQAYSGGAWLKPADGAYGAKFGQEGPMWASGRHTGLDILAPFGSDVRAVAAGQVVDRSTAGPYGNHLLLNHAGGIQSLYAHLNEMFVAFGDAVTAGQRIGAVGMTGNTTGPHLHLEARSLTRGSFDPMELLNGSTGGKAAPPGQVRDWIIQGLSVVGQGNNQAWINGLYTIAMRESGGNPRAINLYDSNAARGTPSKGLLQFIDPTFRQYAMAGYTDIWNPIHQVIADWFYINSRYGGIQNVQQADPNRPPKGYAWGGIVPAPARGTHDIGGLLPHGQVAANMSGRPEAVLTDSQWSAVYSIASNRANGLPPEVHVYVGDREITDIVRVEMRDYAGARVAALTDGRG